MDGRTDGRTGRLIDRLTYNYTFSVDGGWSNWTAWGECNKPCGQGLRFRHRACTKPRPSENGRKCQGKESKQSRKCEVKPCEGMNKTLPERRQIFNK